MFIHSLYVLCCKIAKSSLIENSCFFPTYLGFVFRSCCLWLLIENSDVPVNLTYSANCKIRNEKRKKRRKIKSRKITSKLNENEKLSLHTDEMKTWKREIKRKTFNNHGEIESLTDFCWEKFTFLFLEHEKMTDMMMKMICYADMSEEGTREK